MMGWMEKPEDRAQDGALEEVLEGASCSAKVQAHTSHGSNRCPFSACFTLPLPPLAAAALDICPNIFPLHQLFQLQQLVRLLQHSPQQSPHPPQQSPHPSKQARTPAQQPAMQLAKMSTPHGPERSQHRLSFSPAPPISWDCAIP